ncbi:MAG: NAD(P)-dependent oxidoreductase [Acidimicrobiales bacterium]
MTVLGLGNMGRAFAERALDGGHAVSVWNRTPGRAAELVLDGAVEAPSVWEATEGADAVLVVLADAAAVLDVCLGEHGALAALGPTALLANISTVAPETVRRLAATGPEDRVIDAPVMGAPEMIAEGHGRFLLGGPLGAISRLRPLLDDLGAGYTHCGMVSAGATMKLVCNLLLITGVAAVAEGVATARRHGLSDELLRKVLAESPVVSPASAIRLESIMDESHPGWLAPELARKDLHLAIALAEEAGIHPRVGPATEDLLDTVIDRGVPWPDFTAVIEGLG